jgi:hypothetical protein
MDDELEDDKGLKSPATFQASHLCRWTQLFSSGFKIMFSKPNLLRSTPAATCDAR